MSDEDKKIAGQPFLSRWSKLKQQTREQPPVAQPPADEAAPAPELPAVDELTIDSDFSGFMHPDVDADLRRGALKKLFSDPHFNVMDGLDTYIDDYSKPDPLPAGMLAGLRQAQNILAWARETKEETAARFAPPPVAGVEDAIAAQSLSAPESAPQPAIVPAPDVEPTAPSPLINDAKS
jgi:hypothetical protein